MKRIYFFLIIIIPSFFYASCRDTDIHQVNFSYKAILDREFRFNIGRSVPLTSEKAIEMHGDISNDARYFFYTSTKNQGNYDIYVRLLTDITRVRLTDHPARDTEPAISPDGEKLLFVSTRDDPEGDIFIMDIDPEKVIRAEKNNTQRFNVRKLKAVNLSGRKKDKSGSIQRVKDRAPCWSPDGKTIAFTSQTTGREEVWTMDENGKNLKRITEKGGMYPAFSPDGKFITYISYRDPESGGDLYIHDLKTHGEKQVTKTRWIELYPAFTKDSTTVVFSRIMKDTNSNGKLDLDDRSILIQKDLRTGYETCMTPVEDSSFAAKWFPAFSTRYYKGVLVYTSQEKENINIQVIPDTGIIPVRATARLQYELAERYLHEENDMDRYLLSLVQVYSLFKNRKDTESVYFVTKALKDFITAEHSEKKIWNRDEQFKQMKNYASSRGAYPEIIYQYCLEWGNRKKRNQILTQGLEKLKRIKSNDPYIPYLMKDVIQGLMEEGVYEKTLSMSERLLKLYPDYKHRQDILEKIAIINIHHGKSTSSKAITEILENGTPSQQSYLTKKIIDYYNKRYKSAKRIKILENDLKKVPEKSIIFTIISYTHAFTNFELKKYKEAKAILKTLLPKLKSSGILFYRSRTLLADIENTQNNNAGAEPLLWEAVNKYRTLWDEKDITSNIMWLVSYYEKQGEKLEQRGNYLAAAGIYKKYTSLMSLVHRRKNYAELYSHYGPRAHILYIDSLFKLGSHHAEKARLEYENQLPKARLDFDRAYIYGLGYIYANKALIQEKKQISSSESESTGLEGLLENFKESVKNLDWAIFLDDSFIEPVLLKSWIYQYIDVKQQTGTDKERKIIAGSFGKNLIETNIDFLEQAIQTNDQESSPENEGNLLLNMANSYFMLKNYKEALSAYQETLQYKKRFNTPLEEAQFRFHLGYCLWQMGRVNEAWQHINRTKSIYSNLASGKADKRYANQFFIINKYLALFSRFNKEYKKAIELYSHLLNHAHRFNIPVDRARYLQEIAHCYFNLQNYDNAIKYLNRAERILSVEKESKKTYPLQIRISILGPISIYDLGPDSAILGESRLPETLNIRSKKLLNYSYYTDIYIKKGDYEKTIKYLEKKLKLAEKGTSNFDIKTTCSVLLALGHYHALQSDYNTARTFFYDALDHSTKDDIRYIDGAFRSLLNLTGLFGHIIDNSIQVPMDLTKEMTGLKSRITEYRTRYEQLLYRDRFDDLKKKKNAQKLEVTEEDINKLRAEIADEAVDQYYTIDIALATIDYYLGITKLNRFITEKNTETVTGINSAHTDLEEYNYILKNFLNAEKGFSSAIERSEGEKSNFLTATLYLNKAQCLIRTGERKKAITSLEQGLALAEKYDYPSLSLRIKHALAGAISDEESKDKALKLYNEIYSQVKEEPYLHISLYNQISEIITDYALLLQKEGKTNETLNLIDQKNRILRTLLFFKKKYNFIEDSDTEADEKILLLSNEIRENKARFSALLEAGLDRDNIKTEKLSKKISLLKTELNSYISILKKKGQFTGTIFSTESTIDTIPDDMILYRILYKNNNLYIWRENGKNISHRILNETDKPVLLKKITDMINIETKAVTILLDNTFLPILYRNTSEKNTGFNPGCMFVLNTDRIKEYKKPLMPATSSILIKDKKITQSGIIEKIKIHAGENMDDLSLYTAIIEETSGTFITPEYLLNNYTEMPLLVKEIERIDHSDIILLSEASFYSGASAFMLYSKDASRDLPEIINSINGEKPLSYQNCFTGNFILGIGAQVRPGKPEKIKTTSETLYNRYEKSLGEKNYSKARLYLNRWRLSTEEQRTPLYKEKMALLYLLQDRPSEASALLGDLTESYGYRINILRIFLSLYQCDHKKAISLIDKLPIEDINKPETKLFTLLARTMSGKNDASDAVNLIKKIIAEIKNPVVPDTLTRLLCADVVTAIDISSVNEINKASFIQDYQLSPRQSFKAVILSGSMAKGKKNDERLLLENLVLGKTDQYMENSYRTILELNLDSRIPMGYWADSLLMMQKARDLIHRSGLLIEAYKINKNIINQAEKLQLQGLWAQCKLKESELLLESGNYSSALHAIQEAENQYIKNHPGYLPLSYIIQKAESYIMNGKIEEGEKNLTELKNRVGYTSQEKFTILRLDVLLQLQKLSTLEKATKRDGENFYSLFQKLIKHLEENPSLFKSSKNAMQTRTLFNYSIEYLYKTGSRMEALSLAEIRKYTSLLFKFPELINHDTKSGKKLPGPGSFINKQIISNTLYELGNDDLLFCCYAVNKDIIIWIAENGKWHSFLLKNKAGELDELVQSCETSLARLQGITRFSYELDNLFYPINRHIKNKNRIIFCLDRTIDSVPFPVMGKDQMLAEKVDIVYIPSLLSKFRKKIIPERRVSIIKNTDSLIASLEQTAMFEAGIVSGDNRVVHPLQHMQESIEYSQQSLKLQVGGKNFNVPSSLIISGKGISGISTTELALYASLNGCNYLLMNTARLQDLNTVYFTDYYYHAVLKGNSLEDSFNQSLRKLKTGSEYDHPAYWSGIKLFVTLLKE